MNNKPKLEIGYPRLRGPFRSQLGASFIIWIFALIPLLGLAALAVDVNYLLGGVADLQNAADAGALRGAEHLYDDNGNLQKSEARSQAEAAVSQNLSLGKSVVIVEPVEIGHWQFQENGGQFTKQSGDGLDTLEGKVFYDPDNSTSCDSLNNPCSGEINAVKVVVSLESPGVQAFFGRLFLGDSYSPRAEAVAYLGYAASVGPETVDQPIALCLEYLTDDDGKYSCEAASFLSGNSSSAAWTNFSQDGDPCLGGTNASEVKPLICGSGNPDTIFYGKNVASLGGQVKVAYSALDNCWLDEMYVKMLGYQTIEPPFKRENVETFWELQLPVIVCGGENPGPCNRVVGIATVNVLHVTNSSKVEESPHRMVQLDEFGQIKEVIWEAPEPTQEDLEAKKPDEAYGQSRWNSFVDFFGIQGLPLDDENWEYPNEPTIFFKPDCDIHDPEGTSSVNNFGIRAKIPVLVD